MPARYLGGQLLQRSLQSLSNGFPTFRADAFRTHPGRGVRTRGGWRDRLSACPSCFDVPWCRRDAGGRRRRHFADSGCSRGTCCCARLSSHVDEERYGTGNACGIGRTARFRRRQTDSAVLLLQDHLKGRRRRCTTSPFTERSER